MRSLQVALLISRFYLSGSFRRSHYPSFAPIETSFAAFGDGDAGSRFFDH